MDEFEEKVWAYGLKNALEHEGYSAIGSIVSGIHCEFPKEVVMNNFFIIEKINSEINKLSPQQQEIKFQELKVEPLKRKVREGLPDLPGAKKGKVVMRIAPSPSGAFHIGTAMTACISFDFVVKYGGKFYVRIEDTNPENIYKPAYKLIEQDSKWLFDNKAKIVIQSERMSIYYKYALKLIKKGYAYVCTCSGDDFRKFVKEKKDCPCRKLTGKQNETRWNGMLKAGKSKKDFFKEGEAVLRFKTSEVFYGMANKNPAMRDFPLARINETPHPLQKKKYRVWPLMNLAVPVDDIEMKMTHIIRAKEHRDNAERHKMIYKILGKKFPWTGFLGRWHIKDLRLSASEITKGIKEKKYSGWDDPKLPTIQALKKQGYKPSAFWRFAERIGLSETDKVISKEEYFKLLDSFNKE